LHITQPRTRAQLVVVEVARSQFEEVAEDHEVDVIC
jgi:hypothetical protein